MLYELAPGFEAKKRAILWEEDQSCALKAGEDALGSQAAAPSNTYKIL